MAKFYLYEWQGGGCDYSIGCGLRLREIRGVNSLLEATQKVVSDSQDYARHGGDSHSEYHVQVDGECGVSIARIMQVECEADIDMRALKASIYAARAQREGDRIEAAEKAEFDRLQKKYGGKP